MAAADGQGISHTMSTYRKTLDELREADYRTSSDLTGRAYFYALLLVADQGADANELLREIGDAIDAQPWRAALHAQDGAHDDEAQS